jgi:hypothetical protein
MPGEHEAIKKLLEENLEVVKENHKLLEKMHRVHVLTFWLKFLWFAIIVGLPIVIYYYMFEPYLAAIGANASQFEMLLEKLPELLSSPMGKMMQ